MTTGIFQFGCCLNPKGWCVFVAPAILLYTSSIPPKERTIHVQVTFKDNHFQTDRIEGSAFKDFKGWEPSCQAP